MSPTASTRSLLTLSRTATSAAPLPSAAAVRSSDLLRGQREVLIQHAGETYRLRHTRNGKLILTK